MRKLFLIILAISGLASPGWPPFIGPAAAGGYVAPILEFDPALPPAAAPPSFALCGEPAVCAGLALVMLAFLIQPNGGSEAERAAPSTPQLQPIGARPPHGPLPSPSTEPPPEIPPVPLPASGLLLLGGLAIAALFRRRRRR